ncbi:hypothetical protein PORY_002133 [Pneumocystis oryctolagi]|uniref:Uncharacterized protein n=1 Tax=Pneumocystis oryctolagi TaxID=42067 RepID=A0ACB7CA37_9ASCO|nr:hypothetical protein PORY_002133 [Pneumocystis oryctolagi]
MIKKKKVFVTVGSTRFDALISSIQQKKIQEALIARGFSKILVQYGNSKNIFNNWKPIYGLEVEGFNYTKDIGNAFKESDLIISHAGSGSIIEALELQKQLIVVVNETLMDNHQIELTEAMSCQKYLISSTPENLLQAIESLDKNELQPFSFPTKKLFPIILDNHMGVN